MPRTTGQFTIVEKGVKYTFTRVGETYKSVFGPSGVSSSSRKVIEWAVTEHDEELGDISKTVYVLPRTTRAEVVEQFFDGPSHGIIY